MSVAAFGKLKALLCQRIRRKGRRISGAPHASLTYRG